MKKPVWVVLLVIIAAGIGLANLGKMIPTDSSGGARR